MNRIILRILYDGTMFRGFQRQPHGNTVENLLEQVLSENGCIDNLRSARYAASGRTDKGVSAFAQTIVLDSKCSVNKTINIINELEPKIYAWAYRIDHCGEFHPRYWALWREYTYLLSRSNSIINNDKGQENLEHRIKAIIGCKDYSFLGLPSDTNPYRCIFRISVKVLGNYVVYHIIGESFARQMVRRLVYFLEKGETSKSLGRISLMPPENLLLFNVRYPFSFHLCVDKKELLNVIELLAKRVAAFVPLYLYLSSDEMFYEFF